MPKDQYNWSRIRQRESDTSNRGEAVGLWFKPTLAYLSKMKLFWKDHRVDGKASKLVGFKKLQGAKAQEVQEESCNMNGLAWVLPLG